LNAVEELMMRDRKPGRRVRRGCDGSELVARDGFRASVKKKVGFVHDDGSPPSDGMVTTFDALQRFWLRRENVGTSNSGNSWSVDFQEVWSADNIILTYNC